MTTEMYRSGKRLRVLTNDPNHKTSSDPNLRSIGDVLQRIASRDKSRSLTTSSAGVSSNQKAVKEVHKEVNPWNASKRQKKDNKCVSPTGVGSESCDFRVFKVIYGAYKPNKKHKVFAFDGFLTVGINSRLLRLYSIEGKNISQSTKVFKSWDQLESGKNLLIGGQELEIDDELSALDFKLNKYFVKSDD